ncbi:hypothetical protein BJ912DRAFT_856565, partial [Pholiota molesta]
IDENQDAPAPSQPPDNPTSLQMPAKKRLTPDQATITLYTKWQALLPQLVEPLLAFTAESIGKAAQVVETTVGGSCKSEGLFCDTKVASILCLYFDRTHCPCQPLTHILVRHGLFPTAPEQVRMAISIDFLDFYSALFERSCDAVNAMAAALNTFYIRRGFYLVNSKGERYREPFRRGLGYAAQWLDGLRVLVDKRMESLLEQADAYLQAQRPSIHVMAPTQPFNPDASRTISSSSTPSECARALRQLCPACFGGVKHGRPLEDGGDFQVATDGNFHHRHLASGGESVRFHEPRHVIPKAFVDSVGEMIRQARKSSPKARNPKVPDAAVDECEKSHDAADGDKKKSVSNEGRYDDMGWMSLVCRHDIPLFFANIDTPGEQQKYSIALILWLFAFVPSLANVTVLYDIGCVLDRSTQMYDILPRSIRSRIQFVTTAMHAYGHQWSCQLLYNPRLSRGLGLTDGEGVERTWSRLRKLIPLVRTSSRARRIWLTDRQLSAVAQDLRDDLGDWLKRRQRLGVEEQGRKARSIVEKCGMTESALRQQWALQKEAQLSIRAHAPAKLKRELDTILSLQGDLESVEKAINVAKSALASASSATPQDSNQILNGLLETHAAFTSRVEALYVSLNVHDSYPDLKGASLDFIRTLLMARDLKINIRKRAIGSFFEWDRLDQAVGGRSQTLGTKLHQQTRKAISKRAPALLTAIKKFNVYCAKLEDLYDPACNIPLPLPLPTKLADLRDDSSLMEDVWISPLEAKSQPWLDDPSIRSGIRAMIKLDRCLEEQRRLGREADNLCSWFHRELGAVELAIRTPGCSLFGVQLGRYRDHLLHLKTRWSSPLASAIRFDSHVLDASRVASQLSGCPEPIFKWIYMTDTIEDGMDSDTPDNRDHQAHARDIIQGSTVNVADEEDAATIADEEAALKDEEENGGDEDTSTIEHTEDAMTLRWTKLVSLTFDLVINVTHYTVPASEPYHLSNSELQILNTKDALLDDICINGLSTFLHELFTRDPHHHASASRCAIFSTYELIRIRYKAPDVELWKSTYRHNFWTKDIWIVPIHRRSECHWVLAIVYLQRREVHLFDSLAGRASWNRDVQSVSVFISRLIQLANQHGHPMPIATTDWVARPVLMEAIQTNGHDCGLWVLLWITAVLRGYGTAGRAIDETVMPAWRITLRNLICTVLSSM